MLPQKHEVTDVVKSWGQISQQRPKRNYFCISYAICQLNNKPQHCPLKECYIQLGDVANILVNAVQLYCNLMIEEKDKKYKENYI